MSLVGARAHLHLFRIGDLVNLLVARTCQHMASHPFSQPQAAVFGSGWDELLGEAEAPESAAGQAAAGGAPAPPAPGAQQKRGRKRRCLANTCELELT